ncbi:thiamine pyrophosphate-binding protein [bacterium]|nr:thiamine pyrophosphate-binding protein [bacterium]
MRVADYIANYCVDLGVRHIFMITGGGAMHLNDGFGKNKHLACIFHHHEQACAIAAESYARVTGKLAVANITTGPGGLNTLTGVMGAWTDSVPAMFISGQVKFETTIQSDPDLNLRQLGDQEVSIIDIVKPLTKYARMVTDPRQIKIELDRASHAAVSGRPGPVWLDIPMNVQGALIDQAALPGWSLEDAEELFDPVLADQGVNIVADELVKAERPVIIAGRGVRIAECLDELKKIVRLLKIPIVSTFNGYDNFETDDPLNIGRIGTLGDRPGNFALQNADLVISIGSRNNIRQISYGWENFIRAGKLVLVDIDRNELEKHTLNPFLKIHADAAYFIDKLGHHIEGTTFPDYSTWHEWCLLRKQKYPVVLPEYRQSAKLNPYFFIQTVTAQLKPGDITVAANGTACVALFQAGIVKKNQRIFWNSGCAAMGYDLPAAIGAAVAGGGKTVVCFAGDGSIMMNLQELQTISHLRLPIKIFLLNNDGYLSIKQTQAGFFGLPYIGCNGASGVSFPDFVRLGKAFNIASCRIAENKNLSEAIRDVLAIEGPVLCEVILDPDAVFAPKLSSRKLADGRMISKPLEDMSPFLDRAEFEENMLVPVIPEDE